MPPKPLDFLQTAAPDATNVHNNIDDLIYQSDAENLWQKALNKVEQSMSGYNHPQPITGTAPDVALNPLLAAKKIPSLMKLLDKVKLRNPIYHHTAINQAKEVEAILREKGVLKPGEDFTSKTKIPLDIHNLISGRGGAKAKMKSTSVKVNGDFISDYYNAKGVFYMQMHGTGAKYLGYDPMNVGKELGIPKLEGEFILKSRVFAQSYMGKNGKTAGYTYKIIAEPLLSPKSITSKSSFNLDIPGSWKKMMGTE